MLSRICSLDSSVSNSAIDDAVDTLYSYEPNAVFSPFLGSTSMTFFYLFLSLLRLLVLSFLVLLIFFFFPFLFCFFAFLSFLSFPLSFFLLLCFFFSS